MEPRNIACPDCRTNIEYWTKRTFIHCPGCQTRIAVVPCEDKVDEPKPSKDDEIKKLMAKMHALLEGSEDID